MQRPVKLTVKISEDGVTVANIYYMPLEFSSRVLFYVLTGTITSAVVWGLLYLVPSGSPLSLILPVFAGALVPVQTGAALRVTHILNDWVNVDKATKYYAFPDAILLSVGQLKRK